MLLQTICFAENQKEHVTFIWANKASMTSKQYTFENNVTFHYIVAETLFYNTKKNPVFACSEEKGSN